MGVSWSDSSSSNGEVITPALLNNIRTNINSYHTGGIPIADLAKPESVVSFCISFGGDADGDIPGDSGSKVWLAGFKAKSAFIPTQVDLYYGDDSAGNPVLSLDVKDDNTTFLVSGPLTNSAVETNQGENTATTNVIPNGDLIAAGSLITLHLTNTAAGSNDARFVTVTIHGKAEHTT